MEAAVQSYNSDRLLLTLLRHNGLTADRAARCVLPVWGDTTVTGNRKPLTSSGDSVENYVPVEVVYAVYLGGGIHGEGHAIKAAVTHHTGEAAGVVGLPHGPQDTVQDGLRAL